MKILIVDDSPRVRRMIRSLVAPFSEKIFECADGETAVAVYEQYHPDWVLMDIELGDMDGLTATRKIHRSDPQSKIAIVTAYDDARLREQAKIAGACAYLAKDDLHLLHALLTR